MTRNILVHTITPFPTYRFHLELYSIDNKGKPAQGHKVNSPRSGSRPWESAELPVEQSKLKLPLATAHLNMNTQSPGPHCERPQAHMVRSGWHQGDSMTA